MKSVDFLFCHEVVLMQYVRLERYCLMDKCLFLLPPPLFSFSGEFPRDIGESSSSSAQFPIGSKFSGSSVKSP